MLMTATVVSGGAAAWLWDERQMAWLSAAIAVANYTVLTVYL
jgi:hypothetical protein